MTADPTSGRSSVEPDEDRCKCGRYPVMTRTGHLFAGDGVAHSWSSCDPIQRPEEAPDA